MNAGDNKQSKRSAVVAYKLLTVKTVDCSQQKTVQVKCA